MLAATLVGLGLLAAAIWHRYTQPVGEARQGPIALCYGLPGTSCLIDGDTGRDNGKKWRLIAVDTPEISDAACANEKRLAIAARDRLQALLAGGYRIRPSGRDDPHGRALVDILLPDGRDAGAVLLQEGLAQRWPNRGNVWCERYTGGSARPRG
jgi:endonuclease YncB( thermonuclease family)